jgi:hypothetical protein
MAKTFEGVIFDKDFILKSELRSLGFRKTDIDNEYLRVQDWVHADVIDIYEDDLAEAKRQVDSWKHKIKSLLSRPVGRYAHKRRPNRNLLPMMNSGELRDSIKVSLKGSTGKAWTYELKVNIRSKHTNLTNDNITRAGRDKRKVSWRGWADEMMDGKGLKGVPSARNLMRSLFR